MRAILADGGRVGRHVGLSVALLIEAYRQVNAAVRINDSEQTRNAVSEVNGIIAHYKDVAAQPAKHKGGDEPTPEPNGEAAAS